MLMEDRLKAAGITFCSTEGCCRPQTDRSKEYIQEKNLTPGKCLQCAELEYDQRKLKMLDAMNGKAPFPPVHKPLWFKDGEVTLSQVSRTLGMVDFVIKSQIIDNHHLIESRRNSRGGIHAISRKSVQAFLEKIENRDPLVLEKLSPNTFEKLSADLPIIRKRIENGALS